jgi:hypothetical protein
MKKTLYLLLALFLSLSLCACGGSPKAAYDAAMPEAAAESAKGVYANGFDMEEAEYAAYDDAYDSGFSAAAAAPRAAGGGNDAPAERPGKIIYSANVQVETTDFDGSLAALDALVEDYEGWVESSSVNGSNYLDRSRGNVSCRSASYTLRIPSERFQALMNGLSVLGNVPYSYTYTENVTAQYYDVQARLTAYTTQEQRLLDMMEIAESVEDIILLEDRLTEIRWKIESLQSSLNNWDRQVSYSTVYLELNEVQEYSPEPQVQPSFGQQLLTALKDGGRGALSFGKGLLLLLMEALPVLLILCVLILAVVLTVKKRRKKAQAKRAGAVPTPPKSE